MHPSSGDFVGSLRLEDDQLAGEVDGSARLWRATDILVDVCSRKREDYRPGEFLDRGVAAAGVQREHRIGGLAIPFGADADAVAGRAQERRPAQRGVPVAS